MKRLLLFSLVLFVIACTKPTIYTGTIYSAADNQPVAGAQCFMTINGKYENNETKGDTDTMVTDSTGNYQLEVEYKKSANNRFIRVSKDGYVTKEVRTEYGVCRNLDFTIYPYDAYLSVTLENTENTMLNYWYSLRYPLLNSISEGECGPKGCGPFSISAFSSETQVMRVPGGTDVVVSWTSQLTTPMTRTTIICPRNDTTYITIPF